MTRGGIAVVGMSCRYPDAADAGELWQTVLGRRQAFRRIPEQRLAPAYLGDGPDRTYVTRAGVLRDWQFDRERFGVPGPLYRAADHTHWLALEVAADTLADAGFPDAAGLDRERVGVILGNTLTGEFTRAAQLRYRLPFLHRMASAALDRAGVAGEQAVRVLAEFEELVRQPFAVPGDESLAGALANTIAGRICNHFDLHGAGYTVDGACSSSLLAVLAACRALDAGELDFALAGGVDLSLDPFELVGFARVGALASGDMRIYDAEPTGFLPGEGAGVVALMRARDADAAGLRTYARLIGWGSSSDGAGGLTRPDEHGQALALRRAYDLADIEPASVHLLEGHGTGTAVGDQVELLALSQVRGAGSAKAALGSIKANLGHTKAAAGAAGLIKAALALHHGVLPPVTGCREPHELLRRDDVPLRVLAEAEPWPGGTPRAAASSMGFGGINTHIVLEGEPNDRATAVAPVVQAWGKPLPDKEIVVLSAATKAELAELLTTVADRAGQLSTAELHDLAATRHLRSRKNGVRCALVAGTPDTLERLAAEAKTSLADWDTSLLVNDRGYVLASGRPARVGLLFPGQAAPVRTELGWWAAGLAVPGLPVLDARDGDTDTAVVQPVIVRQSAAAISWLAAMGCRAVGAAGHSLGEISALLWTGALSTSDALALAAERGRLMACHGLTPSTMASIGAGVEQTTGLLAGLAATVSGLNSPEQTSVSGPRADVEEIVDRARGAGIAATVLPVSHGFHSQAMQPVREPLREALRSIDLRRPNGPVFSTVTGRVLAADADIRDLLVEQLTAPVRFTAAVAALASTCDLLVEAGPGTTLSALANACGVGIPVVSIDCGAPAKHALATAVIAAAGAGDLQPWFGGRAHRAVDIDAPMRFLSSPCESVAAPSATPATLAHPEPVTASDGGSLQVLRDYLSTTLELPAGSIGPERSLLGDLHLNSLQLIQTVATVATMLGVEQPGMPESLAGATVQDVADLLAAQPEAGLGDPTPRGVRPWVGLFEHHWVPYSPPLDGQIIRWAVDAPDGHWLAGFAAQQDPDGLAFWLNETDEAATVARILRRIGSERPRNVLVVHRGHPAAPAIARSAVAELSCAATVIEVSQNAVIAPELLTDNGYRELRVRPDGSVERAVTHARRADATVPLPLMPGDVCLVTGGLTGITALCATALAEQTGCTVVAVGRSAQQAPLGMHYVRCDVTDRDSVRAAVKSAREYGPVRALLHGAGVNDPKVLSDITPDSLAATLAPKVTGASTVLSETEDEVRLVVGFGSIIGRRGLAGQAEYCTANEWLRHELAEWARCHPECRVHVLEWSVWDEIGMASRMGVLGNLRAHGITPIAPALGVRAMVQALTDRDAPTVLLVTGQVPDSPTLTVDGPPCPSFRFIEQVPVRIPGVEVVTEAALSLGSDPYLDEHRVDGVPTLPAVIGFEAMAHAVVAVQPNRSGQWCFSDVNLHAPVVVDENLPRTLRVAALVNGTGVDVVVRDDSDGFVTNRFTAAVRAAPPEPPMVETHGVSELTRPDCYGTLFFHSGRFRRLAGYEDLTAFRVRAWVDTGTGTWFSEFHDPRLVLGDPGAHDATIHILQACVPHRRVLPTGVDELVIWRAPAGRILVCAQERAHTVDEYTFDVHTYDSAGRPVSRWCGLRLRAIGPVEWPGPMPRALSGPLISRRLIEAGAADPAAWSTLDDTVTVRRSAPLSQRDARLASVISQQTGENHLISRSRVLHARAAVPGDSELVVDTVVDSTVVVLRSGDVRIVTGAATGVVAAARILEPARR